MPEIDFSHFYTYEEIRSFLDKTAREFPDLISLSSLGQSYEGRDIIVATLTNKKSGSDMDKPAYWIDANIHAGEVTGSAVALYTIWSYTANYGKDERVTRLLDDYAVYVVPRISVDGAEMYLTTPNLLRSSTRRYPYEEDREGLYPEDIDGDGRILQMRIQDPDGAWKASEKDPRVMIRRGPDDFGGVYYHLISEGMINDWDGYEIKQAPMRHGLDLNRNFPFDWAPEGIQRGAGDFPFSEPETRSIAQFWAGHRNINGFVAYHTSSGVLLRPYSTHPDTQFDTNDLDVFKMIGERGTELTGYPAVSVFHNFAYDPKEPMHGAMDDYAFDFYGWYGFTCELWDAPTAAGLDMKNDWIGWTKHHPEEDDLAMMKWNDEKMGGRAFQPWREFEHPQLGKVEIGGWDTKNYIQNAPPDYLPELCQKQCAFTLAHALMSPKLVFEMTEVEKQSEGLFKVGVVVANRGFLPTYTSHRALERKTVRPIEVSVRLPAGAAIVTGKPKQEIGQLEGRTNKIYGGWFSSRNLTDNEKHLEWTVSAPSGGDLQIEVRSNRAGTIRTSVSLA